MAYDWLSIVSIVVSLGIPVLLFAGRNWIVSWISGSVQHRFNVQIEGVRADLRKSEEELKSSLRDREAEISVLRTNVLAGSAGRQALLDKRRFEAVEKVWTAVNDMAGYKMLSAMMASLNYRAIARRVNDPNMKMFLGMIGKAAPDTKQFVNVARDEQPFLPDLAWAYFSAYSTILMGSYARFMVLQVGLEDSEKLFNSEGTRKILKAALPQFAEWIDKNEPESFHHLLEHVEQNLLAELRKVLDGKEADQAATVRAKDIAKAVSEAKAEEARAAAGRSG